MATKDDEKKDLTESGHATLSADDSDSGTVTLEKSGSKSNPVVSRRAYEKVWKHKKWTIKSKS